MCFGSSVSAKSDRDREVVDTKLLSNLIASRDTRQINISGLDDIRLAFDGADNSLCETTYGKRKLSQSSPVKYTATAFGRMAIASVFVSGERDSPESGICHAGRGGTSASFGFDDLVAAELHAWSLIMHMGQIL